MKAINYQPLGGCVYMPWNEVDKLVDGWAKENFGRHAYAGTGLGQDDAQCVEIILMGIDERDKDKLTSLFEKFDPDQRYGPFTIYQITLSTPITLGVFSTLAPKLGLKEVGCLTPYRKGILVMEKEVK